MSENPADVFQRPPDELPKTVTYEEVRDPATGRRYLRQLSDFCWACGTEFMRQDGHECHPKWAPVPAPTVIHRGGATRLDPPEGGCFPQVCDDEDCPHCT